MHWIFGEVGAIIWVVGEMLWDDLDGVCGGEFLDVAPGSAGDGGWGPFWWGVVYLDGAFGGVLPKFGD